VGRDRGVRPEFGRDGAARGVIGYVVGGLTTLLHGATAWRYGYFRDELYFIACAKHLEWGYVDQPPLVAFAAWLSGPFGYGLVALRILPAISSGLTVYVAVLLARELGGRRFAQLLTGVAVALLPAYLLLGNTLTTTSFESLSWTLAIYACVKIARHAGDRWWVVLALSVAFGGYGKYSIALLVVALAIGLLATRERKALWTPWLGYSILIALVLLLPNLWWQVAHGWPIFEVLQGDAAHRPSFQSGVALEYHNIATNALAFSLEQLLYTSPLAVPLWLMGAIAPFRMTVLRDVRFVSVAYLALFVVAAALGAKGYYIIGAYASLLAVGAVALECTPAWIGNTVFALLAAVGIVMMPISIPVLPIDGFIAYTKMLGLTGRDGTPVHLIQPVFAEEFGWGRLARDVASVYQSLPEGDRAHVAIYADTYGDAGALDFFGPKYGLPPAISSQNTYFLWGPGNATGDVMIAIGASRIDILKKYYRSVTLVRTSTEPYKWIVEGPAPIYLCRDPVAPLKDIWPNLRWYGA
jgi:Dolichyl-phosphate-mannose-protein mannosyltransferase